jgi:hypothetical protein
MIGVQRQIGVARSPVSHHHLPNTISDSRLPIRISCPGIKMHVIRNPSAGYATTMNEVDGAHASRGRQRIAPPIRRGTWMWRSGS